MTPVETAIHSVSRVFGSFHPLSMPRLARGHYRREIVAWAGLALGMGAVEGAVGGVIAKNIFENTVSPAMLNFTVAILTGAPAFVNISSFIWTGLSLGRHKIRFLVGLQIAAMAFVALVAFAPLNSLGLLMLTVGLTGARMCWSGVVILRSTVWRANYPRYARAKMAGKIATVQILLMALTGLCIGFAIKDYPTSFRFIYPFVAVIGMAGAWVYLGMRMRGHRALLVAESNRDKGSLKSVNPLALLEILRNDRRYRRFQYCMFMFGLGNLMVTAPLVIMLKDRFTMNPLESVLIATTLPLLLMPVSIPVWSKLLDRVHIIEFRAIHSWSFVASIITMLLACVLDIPALLWVGAVLQGIAYGGGVLAWNLGHHDFAPVEKASQYMGVHVTLTGIRGLVALVVPVGVYELLEHLRPGSGGWVFAMCLFFCLCGTIGFILMRRSLAGPGHDSRFSDGPPVQPPVAG
ncbi:MAG: MFS transporter [Planctomycetes bacterium]|nr:MFS transporter [Planctomycetota bacterium]